MYLFSTFSPTLPPVSIHDLSSYPLISSRQPGEIDSNCLRSPIELDGQVGILIRVSWILVQHTNHWLSD